MLDPSKTYSRKKQILYDENGNKILKFLENAADAEGLTGKLVENMNNYIRCYPDRIEILEQKKENIQLDLF